MISTRIGFLSLPKGRWRVLELEVFFQGELVIVQDKDNQHRSCVGKGLLDAMLGWMRSYAHLYDRESVKAALREIEIVDLWEGPNKPIPGPTAL